MLWRLDRLPEASSPTLKKLLKTWQMFARDAAYGVAFVSRLFAPMTPLLSLEARQTPPQTNRQKILHPSPKRAHIVCSIDSQTGAESQLLASQRFGTILVIIWTESPSGT